jgi:hypothetical protein
MNKKKFLPDKKDSNKSSCNNNARLTGVKPKINKDKRQYLLSKGKKKQKDVKNKLKTSKQPKTEPIKQNNRTKKKKKNNKNKAKEICLTFALEAK